MKDTLPRARVGILGGKALRGQKNFNGSNNASIGAAHEFGNAKVPMRSFLRVPITEHLNKKMETAGAFDKEQLAEVLKAGSVLPWVKKIAVLAEAIVIEAFATGGFGKWPAWKTPGYKNDGGRLLVDTGQLRDSISSDVK